MRRRTKPRVVWLPQTNQNSIGTGNNSAFQTFAVDPVGTIGDFAVAEIPLTIDAQSDPLAATSSLADVYDSGYRLRRIVGKIFCRLDQFDDGAQPTINIATQVLVTAGIIVRRIDPTDTFARSLAVLTGNGELVSPGVIENAGDPWIWRRTWLLYNQAAIAANPTTKVDQGPTNNYTFLGGGVSDGPHIDQKTARVVGPEERLFLDVSATILEDVNSQLPSASNSVRVVTDLRLLASMKTGLGNRRNASR